MVLQIIAYGHDALREMSKPIKEDYPDLAELIENMYETMYNAHGVGLAAPQVGINIRLFIVDGTPMEEDDPKLKDFKKVFINPQIIEEEGKRWNYEEGCLSIPDIREQVSRKEEIRLQYVDENFIEHTETFDGMRARIIQHEYDHLEGVLFTDHISPLRRKLLKARLGKISKGDIHSDYPMKFVKLK